MIFVDTYCRNFTIFINSNFTDMLSFIELACPVFVCKFIENNKNLQEEAGSGLLKPWSTLVEGGKEQYRPTGKLTLELVLTNQNKINFYVYGLCSLPSGPVRFLTSFY